MVSVTHTKRNTIQIRNIIYDNYNIELRQETKKETMKNTEKTINRKIH